MSCYRYIANKKMIKAICNDRESYLQLKCEKHCYVIKTLTKKLKFCLLSVLYKQKCHINNIVYQMYEYLKLYHLNSLSIMILFRRTVLYSEVYFAFGTIFTDLFSGIVRCPA